ncbi:MAG: hypothetical protein HFI34_10700 [Lachnospiraceae bacterium]|nr:hypothetical protein [Lachnospiraceae bacterium]
MNNININRIILEAIETVVEKKIERMNLPDIYTGTIVDSYAGGYIVLYNGTKSKIPDCCIRTTGSQVLVCRLSGGSSYIIHPSAALSQQSTREV